MLTDKKANDLFLNPAFKWLLICLIWLQLMSRFVSIKRALLLIIFEGFIRNPPVFSSVVIPYLVKRIWLSHFGLFAQNNILCNILTVSSCSGAGQLETFIPTQSPSTTDSCKAGNGTFSSCMITHVGISSVSTTIVTLTLTGQTKTIIFTFWINQFSGQIWNWK